MKKYAVTIFLPFFWIFIIPAIAIAQCPQGNVFLNTQADVDNFAIDYPNCTEFQHTLTISGLMSNLNGLNNLQFVAYIEIYFCPNLLNLTGLNNLQTTYGLNIDDNPNLQNVQGLESLTTINGDLKFSDNHNLLSLEGLENLNTINDDVYFLYNDSFNSLSAFSNLTYIGGDLFFQNQNSLQTLNGLENLNIIDGSLVIDRNFVLTDIDALANIDPIELNYLEISSNYELSECSIHSVCKFLDLNTQDVVINGNNDGCAWRFEVEDNCVLGIEENQISETIIFPNPTSGKLEISGITQGVATITDTSGRIVKTTSFTSPTLDISELSQGMYFVSIQSGDKSIIKRIIKQ